MGEVYLVKAENGPYKIGMAQSAKNRLKDFVGLPFAISLEHVIATDDPRKLESYLHERFKSRRVRGEWFDLSGSDVEEIKSTYKVWYSKTTMPKDRLAQLPADYEKTRPAGEGWRIEIISSGKSGKYYGWRRQQGKKRKFRYGGTCVK